MSGPRRIAGRDVGPIGVGGAGWSLGAVDRGVAVATLRAALSAGIDVIDTALAYSTVGEPHHNERLIAEALVGRPERPVIITKGGHWRAAEGDFPIDGSPEVLRLHCEGSLEAFGVDRLDLYLLHHPDPSTPIERSVEGLAALQQQGLVTAIGLSNVDEDQLSRALTVAPIDAVENRASVLGPADRAMIDRTAAEGITYLAYSPLGGDGALRRRAAELRGVEQVAQALDVPLAAVLVARLLRDAPHVVAVVGAGSPASIRGAAQAARIAFTDADLAAIDEALAAAA